MMPPSKPRQLKLNLGCGGDARSGYINLDTRPVPGINAYCDVRSLPFMDGMVQEILAHDILEHFPFREVSGLLKEWCRVLSPNGFIEIRVPNLEGLLELYYERPVGWRREDSTIVDPIVERLYGGQDYAGNFHFIVFDRTSLRTILENCGFFVLEVTDDGVDKSNLLAKAVPSVSRDLFSVSDIDMDDQGIPSLDIRERFGDLRLTWEGPCLGFSGYASAAREYLAGLAEIGVRINAKPIWGDCKVMNADSASQQTGGVVARALFNGSIEDVCVFSPADEATVRSICEMSCLPFGGVHVLHHPPTAPDGRNFIEQFRRVNPGMSAYVSYTTFETDRIPDDWVEPLNTMDEIWVPSRFNAHAFACAGVDSSKIHVIPHGVDVSRYRPESTTPLPYAPNAEFRFLSVFEWTTRKGWDVLVRAYLEEFDQKEKTCLLIRSYLGGGVIGPNRIPIEEQLSSYISTLGYSSNEIPSIELIKEMIPTDDMPRLYKTGDVFVLPTRGEGWGMPLCESMLMEIPVIATRWGGNLEFMNDDNSYLIDVTRLDNVPDEQIRDNPSYAGHKWAEPSLAHTKKLMRHVFENRKEAAEKGRRGRRHIIDNFTRTHAALAIAKRLESISLASQLSPPRDTPLPKRQPRVLFQGRENAFVLPGGDTEVMIRLKKELEDVDLIVDFSCDCQTDLSFYDFIHIFNHFELYALNAAKQRKPYFITPMHEDTSRYSQKAIDVVNAFREFFTSHNRSRLESRLVSIGSHSACTVPVLADFTYQGAETIFVSGNAEASTIRSSYSTIAPIVNLPLGFTRPKDASAIGPDLFINTYGLRNFVLCVGRLESRKNQLMLLYALKEDDVPLVFVNSPSPQPEYEQMCASFVRKGKTLITGRLSEELLLSAYAAAKVHALPSWYELPGLVTLEAAWQGCNIVASDWGTIRDYLGESVEYCDPSDPSSIRKAVLNSLLRPKQTNLRDLVDSFSWHKEADSLKRNYSESLARLPSPEKAAHFERLAQQATAILDRQKTMGEAFAVVDKNPDRAIALVEPIYSPTDPMMQAILGTALLRKGELDESERYLRLATDLHPGINPRFCLFLCLLLQRRGLLEDLYHVSSRCLEAHPFLSPEVRSLLLEYHAKGRIAPTSRLPSLVMSQKSRHKKKGSNK
ncbi:MAG: glycosyltransferase [Myxococcota bacterium]|nr:glycosyltransferase [Myxococcota bacterium]